MKTFFLILLFVFVCTDRIQLPPPQKEGGLPLYDALNNRKSERNFNDDTNLSDQEISQLLWAAYGLNNEPNHGTTVPSAVAAYPFDIYVFMKKGVYKYHNNTHELELVKEQDLRSITGTQPFVGKANMNLCTIGMYDRIHYAKEREAQERWIRLDSGFVNENVYLAAASLKLQAVTRAMFKQEEILSAVGLSSEKYYIPICISVGK